MRDEVNSRDTELNDWSAEERPAGREAPTTIPVQRAFETDVWFYRSVVWILGLVALMSAIGIVVLVGIGKEVPQGLVALGSAAIGAFAGTLRAQ